MRGFVGFLRVLPLLIVSPFLAAFSFAALILTDFTWSIRYGGFVPGSTYGRGFQDCRNFLFTGITYSF